VEIELLLWQHAPTLRKELPSDVTRENNINSFKKRINTIICLEKHTLILKLNDYLILDYILNILIHSIFIHYSAQYGNICYILGNL
jgi:hypothetical protein